MRSLSHFTSDIDIQKSIIKNHPKFKSNTRMSVNDSEAMGDRILGKDPRLAGENQNDLVKILKF
jgi:hypothetical protein